MYDKLITTVKHITYINTKFLKCLRTNVFSVHFWTCRNQALPYLFFTKTWLQALILQAKQNDVHLFLNNILPAKEIKKKWMPQSKVGKLTSCTHWWEKWNLTSFYILGLFQTITANLAIEKKIFNDDALFEEAICQDFGNVNVCKRLRKCGSCHIVPRNV